MRVVIAGAGVIGCATAYECARRGADVLVVDPREPGCGATQASAGMLAPYVEGHSPVLRALCVDGLSAWSTFFGDLDAAGASHAGLRWNGSLQTAFDDDGARDLTERARQLGEAQVAHQLLTGSEARTLEPALSGDVILALDIPVHGHVRPTGLVSWLVERATSAGARLVRDTIVALHDDGDGARALTQAGHTIGADVFIAAAGSWTGQLFGAQSPHPVRPIRGQRLDLRSQQPVASRIIWGPGGYVVARPDGAVLVGATTEDVGFDERATLGGVRELSAAAATLLPALQSAVLERVSVGLRPATPDELPIVGPSATMPHVFYATGHYRNGVLLAPLTARLVADAVLDGTSAPQLEWLRPARFGL